MNLNLRYLRKALFISGLLSLSLLSVAPAKAMGMTIYSPSYKLPFTKSQQDLLLAFTAGLFMMSAVDNKERKKSQKSQAHLGECYIEAIQSGDGYDTWLKLGNSLASQEQFEEAAKCFDRATKHQPLKTDAWKGFGDSLFALERWEEASDAYNAQIEALECAQVNK
jgi:tetratricopeptide (TPR) repeat protein